MDAYIKTRSAFRTAYKRAVLDYKLTADALDAATSTVKLVGGDLPRDLFGSFAYLDSTLYLIASVSPGEGETDLALLSPVDLFNRPRPYRTPGPGSTVGAFVARELTEGWRDEPDGTYAMPYLRIEDVDDTPFVPPALDANGYYVMADYLRTVRRSTGVDLDFVPEGDTLRVRIYQRPQHSYTLIAGDGHTTLKTNTYSRTAVAKVTTVQPVETGELDENGEKIFETVSTDWYLSKDGAVSSQPPQERAHGEWSIITVSAKNDAQEAAQAVFAKNSETHKVEFWTDVRPAARDVFRIRLPSGNTFSGEIAAVSRQRGDRRWLCQAGSLATTLTDKVRKASTGSGSTGRGTANAQFYAVGDVYPTTREGDPAELLGYGAWYRLQGVFLYAADETHPVKSRGGSATHKITAAELPENVSILDTARLYTRGEGTASGSGQIHVQSYDGNLPTKALGDGASFDLLPPLFALYVWVRVA